MWDLYRKMVMTFHAIKHYVPGALARIVNGDPYPMDDLPYWVVGIIALTHGGAHSHASIALHAHAWAEWDRRQRLPRPAE